MLMQQNNQPLRAVLAIDAPNNKKKTKVIQSLPSSHETVERMGMAAMPMVRDALRLPPQPQPQQAQLAVADRKDVQGTRPDTCGSDRRRRSRSAMGRRSRSARVRRRRRSTRGGRGHKNHEPEQQSPEEQGGQAAGTEVPPEEEP